MAGAARRKTDRGGKDYRAMRTEGSSSVTWKWLAGSAFGLLVLGGGGWMTYVQGRIETQVLAMDGVRERAAKQAIEQATTAERLKTVDEKVDAVKKDVQEIRSDLKLLLQNQQQQIRQQQEQRGRR